ncbi:hypothetical protein V6V47_00275 [Micromonospora sp. CPCC 205539]|uniref:ArsR/SmtB family transcription factor n=1 Tax=Micromonospora sp. CPCC 205539 TaxID=3122408 RepID=UPI002FEF3B89
MDEALDVVQSTHPARLQAELTELPWTQGPPPWVRDLAQGRVAALKYLGQSMRIYHDNVLAPLWPGIRRAMSFEMKRRAWQLATQGVAVVLNTLHTGIRWRQSALEVDGPFHAEVDLGGRGLRLMPSIWTRPGVARSWSETTLVYPMPADCWTHSERATAGHDEALRGLLGSTRTRVLRTLTVEHTTSGLAGALGISPASASMHAATLRTTGLVTSRRDGQAVYHAVTALGQAVLAAAAEGG